MTYTVADLRRDLRKPGKAYFPVPTGDDVSHIAIDKSDMLLELQGLDADEVAPWCIYDEKFREGRKFDINN
jgi:hypothetical protein